MKTDSALPPHAPEAERGVLGSLLLAAADPGNGFEIAMGLAQQKLACSDPSQAGCQFFINAHTAIYRAMVMLDSENRRPDLPLLIGRLRDLKRLDEVGGQSYLIGLSDASPSAWQIGVYLDEVLEKWKIRQSIQIAGAHMDRASDALDAGALIAQFEGEVISLSDQAEQLGAESIGDLIPAAMDAIEKSKEQRSQGLATGWQFPWGYMNKLCMGLLPRQLTLIGGESSVGKTSWMLNVALHLAVHQGARVGILSAESGKQELAVRLLCIEGRANGKKVHSGYATDFDLQALVRSAGRLTPAPIFIDDRDELTPLNIRVRGRRLVKQFGCQILMLDHIHECSAPEARGDLKLEGKLLMAACRWLARTLDVPVIVLSQLNREGQREMAKSKKRRPMKSDLRESGYLEQIADNIGILYRDRRSESDSKEEDGNEPESLEAKETREETWQVNLEVVKQRNGPTGGVELTFHRPTFRFLDRYANTGAVEPGQKATAVNEEAELLAEAENLS
jgi:replicative DNA helicase